MKILLRKNIFLIFKDTDSKETYMPSLSGQRKSAQNTKKDLYAYIMLYLQHASRIILYTVFRESVAFF
jgi:hypothetical protein